MTTKAPFARIAVFVALLVGCRSGVPPAPVLDPVTSTTSLTSTPFPQITPSQPPAHTSESSVVGRDVSPESRIAFYSDRDGNPEIYIMDADGNQVTRLTQDPGFDDSPALSPDGAQVAFLTARHDPQPRFPDLKYELYVMDVDGSHVQRLTISDAAEDHPAWSPDGTRISFDADYDGDGYAEIYAINLDGADLTRLTFNQANDQFADWSPGGAQIAFASDRNGSWDVYVMEADGSNQRPLTDGSDWELFPAWAPDGSTIAYNGLPPASRNTDIYIMNADGSDVRRLTDMPGFDENPAWSPDGTLIAFQTARDGNFELYVMNADGSEQCPLTVHSSDELWPSWRLEPPMVQMDSLLRSWSSP